MAGEEIAQGLFQTVMYTLPLAGIGTYYIYKDFINPFWRTRRGQIKVTEVLPNGHLKTYWAKPEMEYPRKSDAKCTTASNHNMVISAEDKKTIFCVDCKITQAQINSLVKEGKLKFGDEDDKSPEESIKYFFKHKDRRMPFIDSPEYVYFEGGIKRAFYDQEGNQMSVSKMKKIATQINPKVIDSMQNRIWNLARADAFKDKKILQWLVIGALGASVIAVMLLAAQTGQMDEINSNLDAIMAQLKVLNSTGVLTPV